MKSRKMLLQVLFAMALVLSLVVPASLLNTAPVVAQGQVTPTVAAGDSHTVGLRSDGNVVAVGRSQYGQCEVGDWMDIVQVAAGYSHTVGVKSDGTVVAVGFGHFGQCEVGEWMDIVQVAAGSQHTVGLETGGTVVAVGSNSSGSCDVGGWTDIVQVAASSQHTVGLKSDGTVAAAGWTEDGQCDVGNWTNIIQVAAGNRHTAGLKSDGTVVAVGFNYSGQCDVGGWTEIIQVTAGCTHTVGLKSDGTVVAVGYNDDGQRDVGDWTDIVLVAAGEGHTVGLKSDGTVVAVGDNEWGQCNVLNWNRVPAVNWPLLGGIIGVVLAVGLVIFFLRRRKLLKMDFAGKIWGFLRRPATSFRAVKEERLGSALKYALIGLSIFAVFTGIVLALQGIDEPSMYIPIAIVSSIIGGMLFVFVGGAWTNLWVYLLAGRKSHGYRQTVKALAYGGTPAYLIGWLLLLGLLAQDSFGSPVLPSILIGLGALALIWALVVTAIGLRELHGITRGRLVAVSVLAIGIAAFVILLLVVVGTSLLAIMGFFWFFGGG